MRRNCIVETGNIIVVLHKEKNGILCVHTNFTLQAKVVFTKYE